MTKFYLNNVEEMDILISILIEEKIPYRIRHEVTQTVSISFGFASFTTYDSCDNETNDVEINTEWEKFEYIKWLYQRKLKEYKSKKRKLDKNIKKLEKCLKMSKKKEKQLSDDISNTVTVMGGLKIHVDKGVDLW